MGRRRSQGRHRFGKRLAVLSVAVLAWALVPGPASAVHFFPLFPGDPLGDCGQTLEAAPAETDTTVLLSALGFVDTETLSSSTVVEVGDTVTWQWVDDYCHTVTSTSGPESFTTWGGEFGFEPQLVRPDGEADSFTVTFDEPGVYSYVCLHHQTLGVMGEVEVVGESTAPGRSAEAPGQDDDREIGNPDKELGKSPEAPGHQD